MAAQVDGPHQLKNSLREHHYRKPTAEKEITHKTKDNATRLEGKRDTTCTL